MKRSQWWVLSMVFLLLMIYFIREDSVFEKACGVAGTPPITYTAEEWLKEGSKPVDRVDLWCINTEIYDPFIKLFFVLMWASIICGWLESKG